MSQGGSYEAVSRVMHAGAKLAIEEINASPNQSVSITPVSIDPAGVLSNYVEGARSLLQDHGLKHVVGCYTSSSRKEVLPLFEKADALLWYPSHYEGFETSENVVYSGAGPNQHIVPLTRHLLRQFGTRGWMVGSNYIWAWENNRILREAIAASGGVVLGERYFPVGEIDLSDVVNQIIEDRPDFVFTTLIGLPVNTDGGYLYLGDCHAIQGDGELCGVALEIPATIEIHIDLIKDYGNSWPQLETEDKIMFIGSARPMEDAARIAYRELVRWVAAETGQSEADAYMLLTMCGKVRLGNMVDPKYSLAAGIEKKYLT